MSKSQPPWAFFFINMQNDFVLPKADLRCVEVVCIPLATLAA